MIMILIWPTLATVQPQAKLFEIVNFRNRNCCSSDSLENTVLLQCTEWIIINSMFGALNERWERIAIAIACTNTHTHSMSDNRRYETENIFFGPTFKYRLQIGYWVSRTNMRTHCLLCIQLLVVEWIIEFCCLRVNLLSLVFAFHNDGVLQFLYAN